MRTTISITTLNLWNTEKWEQRSACVTDFVQRYASDIYCFQEVRPESIVVLDAALDDYHRIEGPEAGWREESTIYLKKALFTIEEYGLHSLNMPEQNRGVFWVKTRLISGDPLLIATIHLTHQLNSDELLSGLPHRHKQAQATASFLNSFVQNMATILCGDFNDPVHPARIFSEQAGFQDVFTLLGIPAPITFPCPFYSDENHIVEAIDKIMIRGPIQALLATSPHFHTVGSVLSDHWPVCAVLAVQN